MKYWYNNQWNELTLNALDGMPIGSIIQFAGSVIPTGWLICDGSSLSEEEYPQLYDVIGHTYGGSGLSFNLPNFKGKVSIGRDTSDTDFDTLGETGGEKTHTLTQGEMPNHTHYINSYGADGSAGTGWVARAVNNYVQGNMIQSSSVAGGTGGAHNNLQPYLVVNYIIKASQTTATMASVVNATNSSTTDSYSCNYVNGKVDGTVLFSGYESGNVTLSDSASNYSYIEVFGQKSGCYGYVKIYSPNGKQFGLAIHNAYDSNSIQQIFGRYTISGTTITKNFEVYMNNNGSPANSNDIRIEKVIGYK